MASRFVLSVQIGILSWKCPNLIPFYGLHYLLFTRSLGPASVQELRPSALRSELAFRALRVSDSSPLAGSGSPSKNFFSWQHRDLGAAHL